MPRQTITYEGAVGSTTYTIERTKKGGALTARVVVFSGLLGTEFSYAEASQAIASTMPVEVVTMTHGRSPKRLRNPMEARRRACRAVLGAAAQRTYLPTYIIGHSLGADEAVNTATSSHTVAGIGLEAPVGITGVQPKVADVIGLMRENMKNLPIDFRNNSVAYLMKNPALAAAEAFFAKRVNLQEGTRLLGDAVLHTFFNEDDVVIRPPLGEHVGVIRPGANHLALCIDPEIGRQHAELFLEHLESQSRQVS